MIDAKVVSQFTKRKTIETIRHISLRAAHFNTIRESRQIQVTLTMSRTKPRCRRCRMKLIGASTVNDHTNPLWSFLFHKKDPHRRFQPRPQSHESSLEKAYHKIQSCSTIKSQIHQRQVGGLSQWCSDNFSTMHEHRLGESLQRSED